MKNYSSETKIPALNQLRDEAHNNAKIKGFYEGVINGNHALHVKHAFFAQRIALITSELSEALEADREEKYTDIGDLAWALSCCDEPHVYEDHFPEKIKNTVEDELADALIRIFDLCGYLNIDIDAHVMLKMEYNKRRPHKHGKKY